MGWRANNLHRDKLQITYSDPLPFLILEIGEGQGGTAQARVYTPDLRTRVKVSVYYDLDPGFGTFPPDITGFGATLWIGEEEEGGGTFSGYVPCNDVLRDPTTGAVITRSAPLSIPQNSNLLGYSQEIVTAGDALFVEVKSGGNPGSNFGRWMLACRWQPDGVRLTDDEWRAVRSLCKVQLLQQVFS